MQRRLIYFIYSVMVIGLMFSILNPKKIFIDRFLLKMNFSEWVLFQSFPSMYSTEIIIKSEIKSDRIFSEVHHPSRIFFEGFLKKNGSYTIFIRYRDYFVSRKFYFYDNTLKFIE